MSTDCQRHLFRSNTGSCWYGIGQGIIESYCRSLLEPRCDVAVEVERDADTRVAKALLDYLGVDALFE